MFIQKCLKRISRFLKRGHPARRPEKRQRLQVEALEDRAVPATLVLDSAGGVSYTAATSVMNYLSVSYDSVANRYTFSDASTRFGEVGITALGPFSGLTGQGTRTVSFSAANVSRIAVYLGDWNDTMALQSLVPDQIRLDGGSGTNTLRGPNTTYGDWWVTGLNAGETRPHAEPHTGLAFSESILFSSTQNLVGGSGTDTFAINRGAGLSGRIDASTGSDTLAFAWGNGWGLPSPDPWDIGVHVSLLEGTATATGGIRGIEHVQGGLGDDTLIGDGSNNSLRGINGHDWIDGGGGRDSLEGGWGNDTLMGGEGNDLLVGDDGNDFLDGWTGDDTLYGGDGDDTLMGYDGNDQLYGEKGRDFLYGERGRDYLDGSSWQTVFGPPDEATDWLYGGDDSDFFVIWPGDRAEDRAWLEAAIFLS